MDGSGKLFENFAQALGPAYELEIVRYPVDECHSYSELDKFVQAAVPLSEPFVVVAESFSSPLGVLCAARRVSNLKGLVICCGFVHAPIRGWRKHLYHRIARFAIGKTLPDFAIKLFLVGPTASASLLAAVRSAISSVQPTVLLDRVRTILACDVRGELSNVTVPTLYLRAKQDRVIDASCLEEIRRIRPEVMVAEIEGPHLLLQREPERAAEVFSLFLQQIRDKLKET